MLHKDMWSKIKQWKTKRRGRRQEKHGEKELYHVYYPPAGKFKGVRLRWNRPGVIIIACCLLDRTLNWSCHFIYTQTTVRFTPRRARMLTRTQTLPPFLTFPVSPVCWVGWHLLIRAVQRDQSRLAGNRYPATNQTAVQRVCVLSKRYTHGYV